MPFWTENVEPLRVVAKKSCQKVVEEEILLFLPGPTREPPRLLTPDSPLALTCQDSWDAHSIDDTGSCHLDGSLYVPIHLQSIGLQSQRPPQSMGWKVLQTTTGRLLAMLLDDWGRHHFGRFELRQYALLHNIL